MNDLLKSFPKTNKEQWAKLAAKELGGKDPLDTLRWSLDADVQANPYYDQSDLSTIHDSSQLQPSSNEYLGPRAWYNMPVVRVDDPWKANQTALESLQNGADGIIFELGGVHYSSLDTILGKIEWEFSPIGFAPGNNGPEFIQALLDYVHKHRLPEAKLEGFILWDKWPTDAQAISDQMEKFASIRALTIKIQPEKVVDELANTLETGANFLRMGPDQKLQAIGRQIGFSLSIDERFFLQLAKLKSLRYLWSQVLGAFEISATASIHAVSTSWINETYQPHGNMIKSTTSAMAAICGGCDFLTVEPEIRGDQTMERIARNVSSVLREESFLNKVADPTAGSYFLESLVDDLNNKVWAKFLAKAEGNEA